MIKVTRDGQMVDILEGYEKVGTRVRANTHSDLAFANQTFEDDQVPDYLLERIKNGEHSGFVWYDGDEEGAEPADVGQPEPDPQSADAGDQHKSPEGDAYDPSKHNQDDVLAYLKDADADEVERVKEAEKAGHDRGKIADFKAKE